ncbi:MAG: hypothetical protein CMN28_03165 [Salinisphaeraceae bacterium]|jgi:hypothetical protein|nr:hypothetical protein [Salinisphaeraceae bacterium]
MSKQENLWSLKEADQAHGAAKGAAFRAFKQLKDGLDEGRDYFYLRAGQDDSEIETLKNRGRIYENSVNAILLTDTGYAALMDFLED